MDFISSEDKKKLANEKRLSSVKQWQKDLQTKKRTIKNSFDSVDIDSQTPNKRVIYGNESSGTTLTPTVEKKPTLFESSDSEDDDEENFAIKPQFEGEKGQQLLEMSSQFSKRFKLDERFREEEPELEEKTTNDPQNERSKNFDILEQVLGFQVPGRDYQEKNTHRKKQLRFDPDDENVSQFMRENEKEKKPSKKSKIEDKDDAKMVPPTSTERYFEVSSDLKTIFGSTPGQFSLSQKFEDKIEHIMEPKKSNKSLSNSFNPPHSQVNTKNIIPLISTNGIYETKKRKRIKFFISKDDPRLKEGVEFFMRSKPLEDIREEWSQTKDHVLEVLKRRQKMSHKAPSLNARIKERKQKFARKRH